ncbi:MAG: ZIP family metal transporter, partial [Ramlibacter sp.]
MDTRVHKARPAARLSGPPEPQGNPRLTLRKTIVFLVCAFGAGLLLANLFLRWADATPNLRAALIGGGMAAAATALGTLPVLLSQNFSKRTYDCFLGFGAGVMLGATAFSLIIPALAAAKAGGAGNWGASLSVG